MRIPPDLLALALALSLSAPVAAQQEPVFRGIQSKQTLIDAWQGDDDAGPVMRGHAPRTTYADAGVPLSFLIVFQYDSAALSETARRQLDAIAEAIKSNQLAGSRFKIEGHTDVTGSDAYNLDLSKRRAIAVMTYLEVVSGINAARLSAVGVGENDLYNPADPTAEENRRVRIIRYPL